MGEQDFDLNAYYDEMCTRLDIEDPKNDVFWNALALAEEAHRGVRRKSGQPYIAHPCAVVRILVEELGILSPVTLASAILHDTVEDVPWVTLELLRRGFGKDVAAIVDGCTKVKTAELDPQAQRKQAHRKIFMGAAERLEVVLVKLADRLHNMRTLKSMPRNKRMKIAEETLDVYAPLSTILGLYDIKRELYNRALINKFPHQSRPIRTHIRALRKDPKALAIVEELQRNLTHKGVDSEISLRTRNIWAYYDPKNHILMERIENPQTIIIQANNRDDCYAALGVLNRCFPPTPRSIRDFIANPKPTGYQGLHARANIDGDQYLFKIRTAEMTRRARRGLVHDWSMGSKTSQDFFDDIQKTFDIMGHDDTVSYREVIEASERKDMYTYTPKGEVLCLPMGSLVLDFAFSINPDLGLRCIGAELGQQRKRVGVEHQLRDGDMVRVLTQEEPVVFDKNLLLRCRTPKARSEVDKTFNARRDEFSRQIGTLVLEQELALNGIPRELVDHPDMARVLARFGVADMPTLFLALGEGRVRLGEVVQSIREELYSDHPALEPPAGQFNTVHLTSLDPVLMKMSGCCRPSPLDKGVIGRLDERRLSLHRFDCPNLAKMQLQRDEAVALHWEAAKTPIPRPQKIVFMRASRSQLLNVLAAAPPELLLDELVQSGKQTAYTEGVCDWELGFRVARLRDLQKVTQHLHRSGLAYEFELKM